MTLRRFFLVSGALQLMLAGFFSLIGSTPGVALLLAGVFYGIAHLSETPASAAGTADLMVGNEAVQGIGKSNGTPQQNRGEH